MSGGSWDYFYIKLEEVSHRLMGSDNIRRKTLGRLLLDASAALRSIEWNDSGDGDDDEEKNIDKCITTQPMLDLIAGQIHEFRQQFDGLLKKARGN